MVVSTSAVPAAPPVPPYKNKKYFLPLVQVMKAIQDEGVIDTDSPEHKFKFRHLRPLATKIWKRLREHKDDEYISTINLPTNPTRGADVIQAGLLRLRKHIDKTEVWPLLAQFGDSKSDKVFILCNDVEFYGYDTFLQLLFNFLGCKSNKKEEHRNGSDAIRVIAIMLNPKYRDTLNIYLKGTKTTRAECDQSVDPNIAWALECMVDFNNEDYIVNKPRDLLDEPWVAGVDPNDHDRIAMDRGQKWFLETWHKYVAPKYRKALDKWDTETGGGSHTSNQFGKFCDKSHILLTWVYLMDLEYGFPLWCCATGKPPRYVGRESGFDTDGSPSDVSTPTSISTTKRRKINATTELLKQTRKSTNDISNLVAHVSAMVDRKDKQKPKKSESHFIMDELYAAQQQKVTLTDAVEVMSPDSKQACVDVMNKRIKGYGRQLKELQQQGRQQLNELQQQEEN